jgi:hypothetical protein
MTLPPADEMQASVAAHQAWARGWMPPTPSRASLALLHQVHYNDSLCCDMGVPHRRKGANAAAELFAPYTSRDYDGIVKAAAAPARA